MWANRSVVWNTLAIQCSCQVQLTMEGARYQLSDYATDYATDLSDYDQFALITASIHYFNASD